VKIGTALGMNVRGVDIVQAQWEVHYCGKEEGVAWADVIVSAMNLTNENRGYFSYDSIEAGKTGHSLHQHCTRGARSALPAC
jgi:phosphoglycerate dehydrogenase-like enzyme